MKRKFIVAIAASLIVISLIVISFAAGIWAGSQSNKQEIKHFTYPLLVGDQTYVVTVETNWTEARAPSVSLLNSSDNRYPLELVFLGGTVGKTVNYKITIPTDLHGGNITLIRKYYIVNPDNYTLSNSGEYNSLQMTFDYQPFFSGSGYFEILGTKGAW
jgi:hypothetical protein